MPLPNAHRDESGNSKRATWGRSFSTPELKRGDKAPSTISEATRRKLEKLRFRPKQTPVLPDEARGETSNPPPNNAEDDQMPADEANKPTSTPVAKRDSSGGGDAAGTTPDKEEHQTSPNDSVMWATGHDNNHLMAYTYLADLTRRRRRGKKRARSSSPTSSPSTTKSPAVDIKKLAQALKSPHADPTLELWDRYTYGHTGNNTPGQGMGMGLVDLLGPSSSPKPTRSGDSATPCKGSNLRRAITSTRLHPNKRRRLDSADDTPEPMKGEDHSKQSLVTSLLDSVTTTIQEASRNQDHSPLLLRESAKQAQRMAPPESPSPKKRSRVNPPPAPMYSSPKLPPHQTTEVHGDPFAAGPTLPKLPPPTVPDFGDDSDDDIFMYVDAEIQGAPVVTGRQSPLAPSEPHAIAAMKHRTPSKPSSRKSPRKQPGAPAAALADLSDDLFDDFDDDDIDDETFISLADQATQGVGNIDGTTPLDSEPGPVALQEPKAHPGVGENAVEVDDPLSDDDLGDEADWDAVELAATQAALDPRGSSQRGTNASNVPGTLPRSQNAKAIQRYLITSVIESEYQHSSGRMCPEKMLALEADGSKAAHIVFLRGEWYETEAHAKSYVHIIGDFDSKGRCIIDDNQNILILHPDQLISATVVADSFGCMRRAVLQDRVKATSEATPPLVYGTLLHEIFQEALTEKRWDPMFLTFVIKEVTERHVEDLYTIKISLAEAREHLESKMAELRGWADMFVSTSPKPGALVQGRNQQKVNMCISKLLDVEEHVWSPMYGLKGNIDATVQVTVQDGKKSQTLTVPFEVKTGKHASAHHMAQTALYNLLLSDRYDINVTCGILYYMETSATMRIPTIRRELLHMIMQRNRLAAHIRERSVQLPPMLKSKNQCGRCYAQTSCFIYHRLADNGDRESSGMGNKFDQVVQHLTPGHQEFFVKWENLLTLEEKESQKFKRELWTMLSPAREKLGRCFSDVVISRVLDGQGDSSRINRFQYMFVKRLPQPGFSFLESQLGVGEPIVVSDEEGHFALAVGYVTAVRKQHISVSVDRRLHNPRIRQSGFDEVDNQVFAGIMEVGVRKSQTAANLDEVSSVRYRLDKDEFSNGMAVVRNNLVQVMTNSIHGPNKIRSLVVDLAAPRFRPQSTQHMMPGAEDLNVDQQRALQKVMSAEDYALVLGMPGTGKTTTIAHIIRTLTAQGKSILLTSYTHTAVDNILLKLKHDKIGILRLGAVAKVHKDVHQFAILAGQPMTSFEQIREAWHDTPVVATTCLGVNHQIFNERTFDYCIVDEASQITLPICLGPIRMARTFVLVGDHNQLPPLVQNEEARTGGLDVSLFKLLSDTHPGSVVNLEHQYRMCEDIMTLSNQLIYGGRLRCGTEDLRMRSLEVPDMPALRQRHYNAAAFARQDPAPRSVCKGGPSCWLRSALDPEARVRFIDTDTISPRISEEAKGNRIVNPSEALIVTQLVESLITVGVPASEIGVMTHYRSQLSLLKNALRHAPGVEMHTADRFQGRDKEVIVLSLVRCNEAGNIGDLLRDWRRINVAFTRAKTKLLVVGSRSTLGGTNATEMVGRFVSLMEERNWILRLPGDALESHYFEEAATQSLTQLVSPSKKSPTKKKTRSPVKAAETKLFGREKENISAGPKRVGASEKVVMKGMVVGRDILNDLTDGQFTY